MERGVAEVAFIFFNSVMHFSLAAEHEQQISMLGIQRIPHLSVRKNEETLKGERSTPASVTSSASW